MGQADDRLLRVRFIRSHAGENGIKIAAGTKIELPRKLAQKLIADGVAAPASKPKTDEHDGNKR